MENKSSALPILSVVLSLSIPNSHNKEVTAYSLGLQPTFITRPGENPLSVQLSSRLSI